MGFVFTREPKCFSMNGGGRLPNHCKWGSTLQWSAHPVQGHGRDKTRIIGWSREKNTWGISLGLCFQWQTISPYKRLDRVFGLPTGWSWNGYTTCCFHSFFDLADWRTPASDSNAFFRSVHFVVLRVSLVMVEPTPGATGCTCSTAIGFACMLFLSSCRLIWTKVDLQPD